MKKNPRVWKTQLCMLRDLKIDHTYQRAAKKRPAKWGDFDIAKCAPLIVGERPDGSLNVIDGQGRYNWLLEVGETKHWCNIFQTPGPMEEAELFISYNNSTRRVGWSDIFRASLAAADPIALDVTKTVSRAGFTLRYSGSRASTLNWNSLTCFQALYYSMQTYGEENLFESLNTIKNAWPGQTSGTNDKFVRGLAQIFSDKPDLDRSRLIKVLSRFSPLTLEGMRKESNHKTRFGVHWIIREIYNHKLAASKRIPIDIVSIKKDDQEVNV